MPEFTLAPEHCVAPGRPVFGYQDIDFEASEEFSKHYLLRGPDEAAIRAAFGAEALGFFAQNPGWSVESCGGSLAVYRAGKRCKPEQVQPFLGRDRERASRAGQGPVVRGQPALAFVTSAVSRGTISNRSPTIP